MYDFEERVKHIVDNIDKVALGKPSPASSSGGRQLANKYVTPISFDGKPLAIQLPLCTTKNGVINNATKTYTDLVFVNEDKDTSSLVTRLIYTLENTFCKLLYENRVTLFASPNLTMDDFEEMLTTSVRLNRQGDVMLRTTIETLRKTLTGLKTKCDIYTDLGESLTLADIKEGTSIVPLITIKELAFSTTSFNMVVVMTECLVMSKQVEEETNVTSGKRRIVFNDNVTSDAFIMPTKQKNNDDNKDMKKVEETEPVSNSAESVTLTITDNDVKQSRNEEVMDELSEVDITLEGDDGTNSIVTDDGDEGDDDEKNNTNTLQEYNISIDDALNNTNNDHSNVNKDEEFDIHEDNNDKEANSINDTANERNEGNEVNDTNEVSDYDYDYDGLYEVKSLNIEDEGEITLKRPDEVYREIYRVAITKAKKLRKIALQAYMDAKKIKARFLVDTLEDSDDESFQEYEEEE